VLARADLAPRRVRIVLIYAASTTLPPLAARAAAPTLELILTR
jgi:hypothetical protein